MSFTAERDDRGRKMRRPCATESAGYKNLSRRVRFCTANNYCSTGWEETCPLGLVVDRTNCQENITYIEKSSLIASMPASGPRQNKRKREPPRSSVP